MRYFCILTVFFAPYYLGGESSTSTSSCVTCHQDYQDQLQGSVHESAGISCHHCHGGDPSKVDADLAMSEGAGFIGVPNKKQIAETCGGCHANVEFMNFWAIPTDQLARYRTSTHGKRVLEDEDFNAASCADCHGSHRVLTSTDPSSSTYPTILPHTCNTCHGDEALMKQYGLPADIFEKYRKSVHGIALLEKGDTGAATCASCHGNHAALPPGVKDISSTCGKCHINERKYFLESPHAELAEAGVFAECDFCHGHHTVQPAELDLYRKVCVECHVEGTPQFETANLIHDILTSYHASLAAAEKAVKEASIEGIFVEPEEAALDEIKTQVVLSEPKQHSLSLETISKHQEAVVEGAEAIIDSIDQKRENLQWRMYALIPIWIFALGMAAVLWAAFKRLKGQPDEPSPDDDEAMSRRAFLGWVIRGGLAATVVGFVAPAIAYIWPVMRRGPVVSEVEVGAESEFAMWGSKKVIIGGSPILVIRTPRGFSAVSAICTHLGCVVGWNGSKREIECPCHAGFFDAEGKVLSGPPPRALPKYTVQVRGGKVFVKL